MPIAAWRFVRTEKRFQQAAHCRDQSFGVSCRNHLEVFLNGANWANREGAVDALVQCRSSNSSLPCS